MSNTSPPKISIVTPSLNQGRFLQDCIDSIRAQQWPNLEHFIIDGGSTDDTMEIIRRNADHLTGYVSESDKGAADAINKGLARCTGDIVAWLNADDFYLPGAFEQIAAAYHNEPDASFWFGNGIRVDELGTEKSAFSNAKPVYSHRALVEGLDYILQPSTFMNHAVLKAAGGLDANLRWSFDWDLWIRLAKLAAPYAIDAKLAATREWGDTLTANGGFRRAEELRRVAEQHSGSPMTPGALCYWIDNMSSFMRSQSDAFGPATKHALQHLWYLVQKDMQDIGVDVAGNPLPLSQPLKKIRLPVFQGISSRDYLIIAVDLHPIVAGVSGGIVPWIEGVLRELVRLYPDDRIVMFHRPGRPPILVDGPNVELVPLDEHPTAFYAELTRHCEAARFDVMIRSYPTEEHPDFPFAKQVIVIPDIQHEYFPEFFSKGVLAARRRAFAHALSRGGAIATMTEHSRRTVVENAWTSTDDVFLMPAALPEELKDAADASDLPTQAAAFSGFFFMPANLWAHKNHRRLLAAFRLALPNLPPNTGLVLTGNADGFGELVKDFADLPIAHLGFVPHKQISALFSRATALVYFSLFEGFGMPVLEAFQHGTPVLCSNTTALPEVGGDAVLSCDPTDVSAMAALMVRAAADPTLRSSLADKAAARLAAYNWAGPARELHAALERLARNEAEPRKWEPLVSIVMPTRNHGRFIRASIDSVLSQDYPNIEFLVMDGASTDDTVDILNSYGDRIRWISEPDKGQADAINKGIARLHGDIVAYLNSDDILLPGAVAAAVACFREHPECDMIYGNADYIDVDGRVIGAYATADYSLDRLMHDCCVCQPAAFWRRRIADRIGTFDASLQTAMDYDYWLRIATSGGIIRHTPRKLAQSRLHEDAKTLAMRGIIYQEIFDICGRHGGYVSLNYFFGLWSYRFYESWRGGERLRALAPHLYRFPAVLHFSSQALTLASNPVTLRYVARSLYEAIGRRSLFLSRMIRKAVITASAARRQFR
ncbi:hypothetical protein DNX69_25250 [Rhodopseudomonas palustris]|uniref:Glycosyltransferase n=1 Tax=Rhodopseudomonas palustris TaxID=1076 RepID=A0A323U9G5_RHOPL|nr:glycosyltransferase [Rhodopseudomonas palustris]PZA09405.1 hypothetical protein DNX69_25250 [Rhodopseudomonas palustris]